MLAFSIQKVDIANKENLLTNLTILVRFTQLQQNNKQLILNKKTNKKMKIIQYDVTIMIRNL